MVALQILVQHGDDADGEVAGDAAGDLEEAQRGFGGGVGVPLGQLHHVLDAGADGVDVFHVARDAVAGVHVAERRVFPAGDEDGQVLLRGGQQPAVLWVDLVGLFEVAREQNLVHELVREEALAGLVGADPLLEHFILDAAHGFHLGDAGVGDAVHVAESSLASSAGVRSR
jgi:hypothetical protein